MLYRQSMENSALCIPIPSTRIRFPKRHVIVHPRNHIQSNLCTNGINIIFIQKSPWKDFYIHHSIYCTLTYKKVQSRYANPVLLIIDEWLLLKPTETEQHDILERLHRRRKKSSTIFCSQYDPSGWYDQLGGDDSPLAEAILDRIKHDAYKINIIPTDPTNYKSMREVYGLDPTLSE